MFDWILNTHLVKIVRTHIWNGIIFLQNQRNWVPTNKQINYNKKIIGKNWINYHSFRIIQAIFWNFLFLASRFLYISDFILQRLSLFLNSEINISVVSWPNFYVFKDILRNKQPFADVFKIGVLKTWRSSTLLKRDPNTGVFLSILWNF